MSRASFCLVALVVLPAAAWAQPPAPARDTTPQTGTAVIRGRVLIDGTDHALPRTQIRATSDKSQTFDANTDGDGRYELKQLPAGQYTVSASRPNYVGHTLGQKRPGGVGTRIDLADGQTIASVDFKLMRAGVIAGRVVDEVGDPVTDVQVAPVRSQLMNGTRQMMPTGRGAMTNDLGEFRIFGLQPGRYYIAAVYRAGMGGDSDDRAGYGSTYYPGTGNIAQAQRITIAAGQTVDGMNFTLLPVRTFKISGIVLDAQGRPLSGGFVNTITRSFMTGGGGATTRPDGKFTISGVTPGDYALRVNLPGNSESATMPITIGDADVSDVQLMTSKPPTIRGRVVLDDSAPAPKGSSLRLFVQNDLPMMAGGNAQVKDDLTFETTMAAGHARVTFFGGDWRLRTVRLDGADVTETGFDVPLAGINGLVVELSARHADLSGTVVDASGALARDYVVLIFPESAERWTTPNAIFSARPPVDGPFKLKVPGGDYYAVALEELEGVPLDPDTLGQLRESAQRLSIADGETRSLVLKFSPPVVY
jgi:Carboxypeptidase regulatory-like domain